MFDIHPILFSIFEKNIRKKEYFFSLFQKKFRKLWKIVTEILLCLLYVLIKTRVYVKKHGKMMISSIFKLLVQERNMSINFVGVTKTRKHMQSVFQKENNLKMNIETFIQGKWQPDFLFDKGELKAEVQKENIQKRLR